MRFQRTQLTNLIPPRPGPLLKEFPDRMVICRAALPHTYIEEQDGMCPAKRCERSIKVLNAYRIFVALGASGQAQPVLRQFIVTQVGDCPELAVDI